MKMEEADMEETIREFIKSNGYYLLLVFPFFEAAFGFYMTDMELPDS